MSAHIDFVPPRVALAKLEGTPWEAGSKVECETENNVPLRMLQARLSKESSRMPNRLGSGF